MEEKLLVFGENHFNKNSFYRHKHLINIDKVVNIGRIVLYLKYLYGKKGTFKYFIGYITNDIKSVFIKLPQMNGYVKYSDRKKKYMNFLVHDKELLNKYNAIWDTISNLLEKRFNIGLVYNNK